MTERLSLHFMYLLHCFDVLMAISSGYYISEHSIGYNGHLTKKKKIIIIIKEKKMKRIQEKQSTLLLTY